MWFREFVNIKFYTSVPTYNNNLTNIIPYIDFDVAAEDAGDNNPLRDHEKNVHNY